MRKGAPSGFNSSSKSAAAWACDITALASAESCCKFHLSVACGCRRHFRELVRGVGCDSEEPLCRAGQAAGQKQRSRGSGVLPACCCSPGKAFYRERSCSPAADTSVVRKCGGAPSVLVPSPPCGHRAWTPWDTLLSQASQPSRSSSSRRADTLCFPSLVLELECPSSST